MDDQCVLKLALKYPKHRFDPVDLLNFVESTEFTQQWSILGLDHDEDLTSLQLCIMAHPFGDSAIEGSGGLLVHTHSFAGKKDPDSCVTVYYAYFEEHGCAHLNFVDSSAKPVEFSESQLDEIRLSLARVKKYLDRLRTDA